MPQPSDPGEGTTAHRVAFTGTWRYRNLLIQVAVLITALGLGMAVSAAVSGRWYGWISAACWIAVGFLAFRQWRRLRATGEEVHAVRRGRSLLLGLGLFLAGVAVTALGAALSH
jgi:low temperature requirement protein LtrA